MLVDINIRKLADAQGLQVRVIEHWDIKAVELLQSSVQLLIRGLLALASRGRDGPDWRLYWRWRRHCGDLEMRSVEDVEGKKKMGEQSMLQVV